MDEHLGQNRQRVGRSLCFQYVLDTESSFPFVTSYGCAKLLLSAQSEKLFRSLDFTKNVTESVVMESACSRAVWMVVAPVVRKSGQAGGATSVV